jgi:hypothetical protein
MLLWQPPGVLKSPPEQKFNLPVYTAHFSVRPALKRVINRRIQPERKCLALTNVY